VPQNRTKTAFLLATTLGLGWSSRAAAATLTFPSASAPCNGTLQACIDGAASGDRIEIASANRIEETISISRSLTLTGAPGIVPLLGSADFPGSKYLDVSAMGEPIRVELRGLKLDGAYLTAYFGAGKDNALTVADCEISNATGSTSNRGIDLDVRAPAKVALEHNVIRTDGYGISLTTSSAGEGTFDIVGNSITAVTKTKSASGIDLSLRGAGKVLANVVDNVVFGVADCHCGGASGIEVSALESVKARVFLTNNTLADLASSVGIYVSSAEAASTLETYIFNNIVSGAQNAVRFPSALPNLTILDGYNDFYGSLEASYVGGYPLAATDLDVDPAFVQSANHDFRLTALSPLVDAAMSLPPGGLPSVDADDHLRTAGAAVDIGAYEAGAVASSDLKLTAETKPASVAVAGTVTFSLHVVADGPSVARDVRVALPLPKGATLVSATTTLGTCSGTGTVTCALDWMARGSAADIAVVATLATSGAAETTARVSSVTADPRAEDNAVTLSVDVAGGAADGGGASEGDGTPSPQTTSAPDTQEGGCSVSPGRNATPSAGALFGVLFVAGVVRVRKRRSR
jgi:MYXO-CTERM domain-containing protein